MKHSNPALRLSGNFTHQLGLVFAVGLLSVLFAPGCDIPDRPELAVIRPVVPMPSENPVNDEDSVVWEPPSALVKPTWETWDAYFVNNEHIGYSHVRSSPATSAMPGDVHFNLDHRIYQSSGNATTLQRLSLTSNETRDGRLLEFDGLMQVGLGVTRFNGALEDSKLVVEIKDANEVDRSEIPWEYNYRGMFAVEQSLRAKPMREKGETRSLKMLISGQYQLATAELRCSGLAVVPTLDGSEQELIEINVELLMEGAEPIYSAIWTDEQGNVVRTYSSVLNIIAYRTDQDTATKLKYDDSSSIWIKVPGKMERPRETRRVAYRINQLVDEEGMVAKPIKPGPGQFVRSMGGGETQVLVSRQDEIPAKGFVEHQPKPSKADRRPSTFIDSRSDIITEFAQTAIGSNKMSDRDLAIELAGTAQRMVIPTPEKCGLAKASDIARIAKGDSTQRSVLLAALLRAQKIPARLAIGLKFVPESEAPRMPQRMVGHVWTMAYVGETWIHLDADSGGLAAADRLMIDSTSLSGENQNQAFRELTSEIGRMEIEVLIAKY